MIFNARFGPGATLDSDPDASTNRSDLAVPPNEISALKQVISQMTITGTNDAQKRLQIAQFFAQNYNYSMWQGPPPRDDTNTPLARFLQTTRSGHCEYFATAAVLVLRQLGIPARYAVGYAVHEASGSGYVVREHDAHAWCLAWDEDKKTWMDFDTTPASWVAAETRNSPLEVWLADARAWLGLQFEKFRWRQAHLRQYILWTLSPVMAVLAYFIIFQRRSKRRAAKELTSSEAATVWPGHDSAFYLLEKALTADLPREPGEPLSDWLERALATPSLAEFRAPLRELMRLHYRYRFDPHGITDAEKKTLVERVEQILEPMMRNAHS
jgi:protein-glutamine gamma-glutamyltransferase